LNRKRKIGVHKGGERERKKKKKGRERVGREGEGRVRGRGRYWVIGSVKILNKEKDTLGQTFFRH
jgi:hypothetical protein